MVYKPFTNLGKYRTLLGPEILREDISLDWISVGFLVKIGGTKDGK